MQYDLHAHATSAGEKTGHPDACAGSGPQDSLRGLCKRNAADLERHFAAEAGFDLLRAVSESELQRR
jgi:hypothetical protein